MNPRNRSRSLRLEFGRDRLVMVAIGLVVGILLAITVFRTVAGIEHRRLANEFEDQLSQRVAVYLRELTLNAEVIHAARALFRSSREVTRDEFARFAQDALARHTAIHALEWIPHVTAEQREVHVHRANRQGLANYRIHERAANGEPVPAATRGEYYPVYFVEPVEGNELALGFDISSDATRRRALLQAAETGELTFTDPIDLVQGPKSSRGLLALVPVFDGEIGSPSLPVGFVLGVFRFDEISKEAFAADPEGIAAAIRWELAIEGPHEDIEIMYASHQVSTDHEARWSGRRTVEFGGQRWQIAGYASTEEVGRFAGWLPLASAATAFLFSQLVIGLGMISLDRVRGRAVTRHARMLHSVLRSVNDGVLVANKRGRFILANRAAQSLVVGDADSVPPTSWSEAFGIYCPDTETRYPEEQLPLARAIRGESSSETEVYVRNERAPDGMWLSVNGTPLIDEAGSVRGGVVVFRDISERKAEEGVRLQLANAVEQTADAVIITDREGRIEYVNPAFEASTGYSRQEALGRNPRMLKSGVHDEGFYERLWKTILAGDVHRTSTVNRRKNGTLYPTEQTITPIKDAAGRLTHFVSVVRDMTEHRQNVESAAEMRLAAQVQEKLYPHAAPEVSGYDIRGAVLSADATCGDYFDFIDMPGAKIGLAIGDVSGHGIGAALVMAETRALLRTAAHSNGDPAEVFRSTNDALAPDLEDHRYVTLLLACLDPASGHLLYSNAGHTPGYIIDEKGCPRRALNSAGRPLGMFPGSEYHVGGEADLRPGELLVLLTDGVEETASHDGEFFGPERTVATLARHRAKPAKQIVDELHRTIREFAGDQALQDDVTIVVCKRKATS